MIKSYNINDIKRQVCNIVFAIFIILSSVACVAPFFPFDNLRNKSAARIELCDILKGDRPMKTAGLQEGDAFSVSPICSVSANLYLALYLSDVKIETASPLGNYLPRLEVVGQNHPHSCVSITLYIIVQWLLVYFEYNIYMHEI